MRKLYRILVFYLMVLVAFFSLSINIVNMQAINTNPENIEKINVDKAIELGENRFILELEQPSLVSMDQSINIFSFYKDYQMMMINNQHQKIKNVIQKKNIPYKTIYDYKYFFNGFSIKLNPIYLDEISKIQGIKKIYGINQYYLDRAFSVPAINAPKVWELKDNNGNFLTGKNITVGVIDTGIDYTHPDLGGGIGKKPDGSFYKVITGYDFSEMDPISFDPTYSFHGTHVAGIIAGIGEAGVAFGKQVPKGVAPDANLISYKVFTNKAKSTGSDAILFALEQAYEDHCDVVNLSLGRDYGWTEDPLAKVCDKAVKAGIIVVASAGNDGFRDTNYNLFPIHTPGTGLETISVASSDETQKLGFSYSFGKKIFKIQARLMANSPELPLGTDLEIISLKGTGSKDSYSKVDVTGKVVLIKRGNETFQEKNDNAKYAGAKAVIVYNYSTGLFSGVLEKKEGNIPMIAIDKSHGEKLVSILENNSLIIKFDIFSSLPILSNFSSSGPTPDLFLKPDITAPGSNILSSVPFGGYDYASGTSMSAPHVSGGAAILKQLHPDWDVAEIKSLLINYTDILKDPAEDEIYSLYRQGSGQLNLLNSVQGNLISEPVSLSLQIINKIECAYENNFSFTITNKSNNSLQVSLSSELFDTKNVQIEFESDLISINPSESKTINGKLVLLADHFIREGYNQFIIYLKSKDNPDMHLSGIFYYGNATKWDPILHSFCFPTLAISPNGDNSADNNELYFLTPYLTDGIEIDLFTQDEKTHLGVLNYYRGLNGAGYFSTPFDGTIYGKPLEDGIYSAIPSILPLGQRFDQPDSWLKGKSVKMLIDREPPKLSFSIQVDPLKEFIHINGNITDNNSSLGLFCYYEIDNDIVDLISVGEDGSIKTSIPMEDSYLIIKITAQDLAGNTVSFKKRLF